MFRGIITPMITPFKRGYEIDFEALEWLTTHLVKGGVHAVFPNSTAGEAPNLTASEKRELISRVIELASGRTRILPGIGGNSTLEVLELGKFVKDLGADGGIVITPYFYKPTPKELKAHYGRIAESLEIPIIIYHFPALTGVTLTIKTVSELALEYSNIVGLKVTYDNLTYLRCIIDEVKGVRKDFSIFSGLDQYLLINLMLGGDGDVAALSNLTPKLHRSIYDAWLSGDLVKAYSLYTRLLTLTKLIDISSSTMAAVKAALSLVGAPIEPVLRPPLSEEGEDFKKTASELLKEFTTFI
ncbi:MAG: 4-hydroxy-tetrahydrodipicolinate synthase [Zestosphaera sp.]